MSQPDMLAETKAMYTDRLLEMARAFALDRHVNVGGYSAKLYGQHDPVFETCGHPDCVLVRESGDPGVAVAPPPPSSELLRVLQLMCGAEPGCNIDCELCAALRAVSPPPQESPVELGPVTPEEKSRGTR